MNFAVFRYDILDYIEDPHEAAKWMFDQQQQMIWPFKTAVNANAIKAAEEIVERTLPQQQKAGHASPDADYLAAT